MQTYKLFPNMFAKDSNLSLSEARQVLIDILEQFPEDATEQLDNFYFGKQR